MKVIITSVLAMLLLSALPFATGNAEALVHNIRAEHAISPGFNTRTPINIPTPVSFEFTNKGDSNETNVKLKVIIKNSAGTIIYRDSLIVPNWQSNHVLDTSFKDFTPTQNVTFHIIGIAVLASDEDRSDDTMMTSVASRYETDAVAISVLEPQPNEVKIQSKSFVISGLFQSIGITDLYDVPIRARIMNCTSGSLVFQSDTLMPELYMDSAPMKIVLPSKADKYSTSALLPGCYKIAIIVRRSDDGDRTNDTVYSEFSVAKKTFDDDVAASSILSPPPNSSEPPDRPIHVLGRFQNTGLNTESNVSLISIIKDKSGKIVYQDTSIQYDWASGEMRNISFTDFFPPASNQFILQIFSALLSDQLPDNDAIFSSFTIGNSCEVGATSIIMPSPGAIFPQGVGFIPMGTFRWEGNPNGKTDVPVRILIRRCDDYSLIFQRDSTILKSLFTSDDVTFTFPSMTNEGGLKDLSEGCYTVSLISMLECDADRINDTVQATFRIGRILNDIGGESIISPAKNFRMLVNTSVPVSARFINIGTSDQFAVRVSAFITDPIGKIVYRDTVIFSRLNASQISDAVFKTFTPTSDGFYKVGFVSLLPTDGWNGNDTLWQTFKVTKATDAAALSVIYPEPNAIIHENTAFQIVGSFKAVFGLEDFSDVPVRAQIKKCDNNEIVFLADAVIPTLMLDSPATKFKFPNQQGNYDTRNLAAGCYKLEIIAMYSQDLNQSNDTAYIPFSIFGISRVQGKNALEDNVTLDQNYPNPLSANTTISYSLPEQGKISLRILDMTGRTLSVTTPNELQDAGTHSITLNLHDVPNGVYIYELSFSGDMGAIQRHSRRLTILNSLQH